MSTTFTTFAKAYQEVLAVSAIQRATLGQMPAQPAVIAPWRDLLIQNLRRWERPSRRRRRQWSWGAGFWQGLRVVLLSGVVAGGSSRTGSGPGADPDGLPLFAALGVMLHPHRGGEVRG